MQLWCLVLSPPINHVTWLIALPPPGLFWRLLKSRKLHQLLPHFPLFIFGVTRTFPFLTQIFIFLSHLSHFSPLKIKAEEGRRGKKSFPLSQNYCWHIISKKPQLFLAFRQWPHPLQPTNPPFSNNCFLWFCHRSWEFSQNGTRAQFNRQFHSAPGTFPVLWPTFCGAVWRNIEKRTRILYVGWPHCRLLTPMKRR